MQITYWSKLSKDEQQAILTRPAQTNSAKVEVIVQDIIDNIKDKGDEALKAYSLSLDHFQGENLELSQKEIDEAQNRVDPQLKEAIYKAYLNIKAFHEAQKPCHVTVQPLPGVTLETHTHPIESVGLYVPGGSAPLVSTALMLAIPAKIAGCKEIILCSPPPICDPIIYAAKLCGVDKIFTLGGAQAIAAMAYGTESVPKVLKIFGPGNQFVTMAKALVSEDPNGAAIDMPAGPSEVLVIADESANPKHVASDLLSQAEHGPDSQVILVATSQEIVEKTLGELNELLELLPRKEIAKKALSHSALIVCDTLDEAVTISNTYAPEHLIVETQDPRSLVGKLYNAGSIFLGDYTSESLGDYAQGTNHTLPTYGYAKTASALGTDDYRRRYTVSEVTKEGLLSLAPTVHALADAEGLFAHGLAVTVREESIQNKE